MKTHNVTRLPGMMVCTAMAFAAWSSTVLAADFNPQPDPPGKSLDATGVMNKQLSGFNEHNPPDDKSAKHSKTQTLLPAVQKTGVSKKLKSPMVGTPQAPQD